jgi:hypothetical protein
VKRRRQRGIDREKTFSCKKICYIYVEPYEYKGYKIREKELNSTSNALEMKQWYLLDMFFIKHYVLVFCPKR